MESGDQRVKFKCQLCHKIFKTKRNLDRHLKAHYSTTEVKCEVCKNMYKTRDSLAGHWLIKHSKRPPHTCHVCKRTFATIQNLQRHSLKTPQRFSCTAEGCDRTYLNKVGLMGHLRVEHNEVPIRFSCSLCGKEFKHKKDRNDHIATHTGEKPYKCYTCGKSFIQMSSLKAHKWIHTEKSQREQFSCHQCPATLLTRSSLQRHVLAVHAIQKNFNCASCDMNFASKDSFRRHVKVCHPQSNTPVFSCDKCEYKSIVKPYLVKHIKIHDIRRHECYFCGKKFKSFPELARHCGIIHNLEK